MTLEEAIRLLDPKTTGEAIAEIEYYNGFNGRTAVIQAITDACEIAAEALGKQMPQKVKRCEEKHEDFLVRGELIEGRLVKWAECPQCGKHQQRYFKFCPSCGQALEWGDGNV